MSMQEERSSTDVCEQIEKELYLLSNEVFEYNKRIKECKQEIKEQEEMKKEALLSVKQLFEQIKSLEEYDPVIITRIDEKYMFLLQL